MSIAVPLAAPLVACDGTRFEIDANLAVYERAAGLKQLSAAETRGALSLRELCNCAFRLRGRKADAEARALTLAELATIVFGPERQPGETHALAAALAEMGLARDGADDLWTPRVGPRTRALDRTLLDAYGEAKPRGRLAGAVRRHSVPMHLRQYNSDVSGRRPSQEKRRTYAEARRQFRMWHVLPGQLPPDCTWVAPYGWGGLTAEAATAVGAGAVEQPADTVAAVAT